MRRRLQIWNELLLNSWKFSAWFDNLSSSETGYSSHVDKRLMKREFTRMLKEMKTPNRKGLNLLKSSQSR